MNNTKLKAYDAIGYSGKVHIQYKFGNKTRYINRHNEGLAPLFSAIVLSLGEQSVEAAAYMPRFIMAKDTSATPVDCLRNKLILQDRKYYNGNTLVTNMLSENATTIRYTFVIPVSSMLPGKQIKTLQLINSNDNPCAEITLPETGYISTDIDASLLIYWDLTFANVSDTPA